MIRLIGRDVRSLAVLGACVLCVAWWYLAGDSAHGATQTQWLTRAVAEQTARALAADTDWNALPLTQWERDTDLRCVVADARGVVRHPQGLADDVASRWQRHWSHVTPDGMWHPVRSTHGATAYVGVLVNGPGAAPLGFLGCESATRPSRTGRYALLCILVCGWAVLWWRQGHARPRASAPVLACAPPAHTAHWAQGVADVVAHGVVLFDPGWRVCGMNMVARAWFAAPLPALTHALDLAAHLAWGDRLCEVMEVVQAGGPISTYRQVGACGITVVRLEQAERIAGYWVMYA